MQEYNAVAEPALVEQLRTHPGVIGKARETAADRNGVDEQVVVIHQARPDGVSGQRRTGHGEPSRDVMPE